MFLQTNSDFPHPKERIFEIFVQTIDRPPVMKLLIRQLRTERAGISKEIRPVEKTPRRFKKTLRRFGSNVETFFPKHRSVTQKALFCKI